MKPIQLCLFKPEELPLTLEQHNDYQLLIDKIDNLDHPAHLIIIPKLVAYEIHTCKPATMLLQEREIPHKDVVSILRELDHHQIRLEKWKNNGSL